MSEEAVELIEAASPAPPLLVCSEHASNRLPAPWSWDARDRWLPETHWAYDIGAAELACELARAAGAPAVLARFSRLLADANRPPDSPTWARAVAEGRPISLNQALDEAERARRMVLWEAYHHALDRAAARAAAASSASILFAVHSFTPEYEGKKRDMEIGVLFDREEELAHGLRAALERISGVGPVLLNEPYSGRAGLMYSPQRHADAHGLRALEIEVRQDCILDPQFRAAIIAALLDRIA